ncbi:serine/threonine-protein kinase [Nocardiopsis baichengensis]|uniref:serine/threonine-protein kinase n=1 Tax=Nocardiopsis baichengensis TaxID=280240 RepID=UPI0003450760|nr:serine/threonine-protein kinase [Nocardiopsis baichengensis]
MSRRSPNEMSVLVPPNLGPASPSDPRRLGPYLVIGRIGSGGTGTVFAAVDPMGGDDPLAAVKVLHSPGLDDPRARAQLRSRLEALAAVDGRVYVPPVRFDTEAAPPWLAMPYVSGIPMAAYIRRRGPMGPGRLLALAAGLAEGLMALHRNGVPHGDIKPGNVLIGSRGPRILDCALPGDDEVLRRTAGAWIAPERHQGAPPSPAADVYSWGMVLAFAATGRLPFGHGEPEVLARRVLTEEPELEGVPRELLPLVERALAKDPAERPSIRELIGSAIAAWEQGAAEEQAAASAAAGVRGTAVTKVLSREWQGVVEPARLPRVIRLDDGAVRRPGRVPLLIGGAAVALALVGGGAWVAAEVVGGGAEPPPEPSPEPSEPVETEEGPRTATVRFDPTLQEDPQDGPWVFTPVEEADADAPPPEGGMLAPDDWSSYWRRAEGAEPQTAVIPDDAEVYCAHYCQPGDGWIEDGRGTYETDGAHFTDYLSWGRVVIAEVEFDEGTGEGEPEIVRITELYPQPLEG